MALVLIMATWIGGRMAIWEIVVPSENEVGSKSGGAFPVKLPSGRGKTDQPLRRAAQPAAIVSSAAVAPGVAKALARWPSAQAAVAVRQARELSAVFQNGAFADFHPALAGPVRRQKALGEGEPEPLAGSRPEPELAPVKDDPRWSGDNWLLMRAGSGAAAQAPGAASYGASQAGAIVRYRLGRGDVQESYGYLRTSLAINAPGKDKEIALGFGVRPVARLPLRVLAEARLQDTAASPMQVRPVATVITELPSQALPLGFRAEAYAQAGYAGGREATPFYDAQLVVEKGFSGIGSRKRDIRMGAGIWSGGQKGAVRLDAGPRASFRLDLGDTNPARIAIDWRFRLAGNARPASGPALTIASSF